eukprot:2824355-Prorocentrum_lima.AAC.1
MTSSLVGSEMCIRDRAKTNKARARTTKGKRKGKKGQCQAKGLLCSSIPVSYTHLTLPTICSV